MNTKLVIGLTGGIGSGKTLASDHFASLGVDIIDADIIARKIVEPGAAALEQLAKTFGSGILNSDGTLNRDALRTIAFSSKDNKAQLDAITHPAIGQETRLQIQASRSPYCVVVVPLLTPESAFLMLMKRVLVVTADHEIKVERVKSRSYLSQTEVLAIMQTQLSDDQRLEFADDVIENNSSKKHVRDEVEKLHKQYLALSE
mgnify:CR=1 FL=1